MLPSDRRPPIRLQAAGGFKSDRHFIGLKFLLLTAIVMTTMALEVPPERWIP
jgi:hypothetical protein